MAAAEKTQNSGLAAPNGKGGHRLSAAFDAVNTLPALTETTARVAKLTAKENASAAELVELVESDTAVTIAVMKAANNGGGPRARVSNVPDAVEALTPAGIRAVTGALQTYELFQPNGSWARLPERFRRHAVATQHAAESLAALADVPGRDELATAALLHDIGQLVLLRLYPGYRTILDDRDATPEDRCQAERRELGIDHTLVGGVLARRWGLPVQIAGAIERHHSDEAKGLAAAVRLSDLVVHHSSGRPGLIRGDERGRRGVWPQRRQAPPARLRISRTRGRRASVAASPARCPGVRSTRCEASPRARSTRRSPPRWGSRRAPSGPTSTTCTERSAPLTEPRPCWWPANEAGSSRLGSRGWAIAIA